MNKKMFLFAFLLLALPLALADTEVLNDDRLDVNGSVFDVNFVTPDTAFFNINNGGGGALELHLQSAEYTAFYSDYVFTAVLYTGIIKSIDDIVLDAHSISHNSSVVIQNSYPNTYADLLVDGSVISERGIKYVDMGGRPVCNVNLRGQTWFTQKIFGFSDQLCICKKDRYGGYNWINMAREDNLTGYICY